MVLTFDVQGLGDSRKLDRSEMNLRKGDGARVAAIAVGTYELVLPSGLIHCYYVLSLSLNNVSLSYWIRKFYMC